MPVVKNPPANEGDIRGVGSIPGLGRSPGGKHGKLLQYFFFSHSSIFSWRIPMERGAWQATVHIVAKSRT